MKIFDFERSNLVRGFMGGAIEAGGMLGMGMGGMAIMDALSGDGAVADGTTWRNAHEFNGGAAMWSFNNIITPKVAAEHPDWSGEEVHQESMRRWELKLFQDKVFTQKEATHAGGEVQWEVLETAEGRQLATRYGDEYITLKELWDNTRQFAESIGKSYLYNQTEADAQMEMQRRFVSGLATGYVSPLSHPDSVELVQVWQRSGENTYVSKQIDLFAATGRDLSHEEGNAFIDKLANYVEQNNRVVKGESSHPHFMIQSGKVNEQDIKVIARASILSDFIPRTAQTLADAGNRVTLKAQEAFGKFGIYLKDQIDSKLLQLREGLYERIRPQDLLSFTTALQTSHEKNGISQHVREFSVHERSNKVKSMMADWFISRNMLAMTTETGLGVGGALYWFAHLGKKQPLIPERILWIRSVESRIARKDKKRFANTKHAETRKHHGEQRVKGKKISVEQQKGIVFEKQKKRTYFREQLVGLHKRDKHIEQEGNEKVVMLLALIRKIMKRKEQAIIKKHSYKDMKQPLIMKAEKKQPLRGHVLDFSTAFIFWILLRSLPMRNLDKHFDTSIYRSKIMRRNENGKQKSSKQHESEALAPKEPTQWLLLAIIWYLVMIRESRGAGSGYAGQANKQTSVKKQSSIVIPMSQLPQQGVIFASAT